jgi:hypothetical protein
MGTGNLSVVQLSLLMDPVIPVRYLATLYKPTVYFVFKKVNITNFYTKVITCCHTSFPFQLKFYFL